MSPRNRRGDETERRRRHLKVVKLLPGAGWTSGAADGGYEGEDADESAQVPSSVRWRLTFTTPQEERQLARAWRDLESQAMAILPKTVRARAWHCWGRLTEGGYISWRPDTLGLIVDGIEPQGHQPSGPGRICRATAPARESPVLGRVQNLQGALLLISVFADDLMLTDGSRALTVSQSETSHC